MAKIIILNYPGMRIGGIESYFAQLMKMAIDEGMRVIWLTTKREEKKSDYRITSDRAVEKCHFGGCIFSAFGTLYPSIKIQDCDDVVMISCDPMRYVIAETLRHKVRAASFKHFLLLPHFTGPAYYPERFFKAKFLHRLAYSYMVRVANSIAKGDSILGFSPIHLNNYSINYNININNQNNCIIPRLDRPHPPIAEEICKRAGLRSFKFIITSCCRFDFPHKAYVLGLVDAFPKIKQAIPNAELVVIGYGAGEELLRKHINAIGPRYKKSIHLLGKMSAEELDKAYLKSSVVVGVAGAARRAAQLGVPTIIMKHYTAQFLGYGLYQEAGSSIVSDEEKTSRNMLNEIIRLCSLSNDSYIDCCQESYKIACSNGRVGDIDYFFSKEARSPEFNHLDTIQMRLLYFSTRIVIHVLGRSDMEN